MIGGPVNDEIEFIGEYPFARQLLDYVENTYEKQQWCIASCYGNFEGEYYAEFKDFWNPPIYRQKKLIVRIVKKDDKWAFSVHKELIDKGPLCP